MNLKIATMVHLKGNGISKMFFTDTYNRKNFI